MLQAHQRGWNRETCYIGLLWKWGPIQLTIVVVWLWELLQFRAIVIFADRHRSMCSTRDGIHFAPPPPRGGGHFHTLKYWECAAGHSPEHKSISPELHKECAAGHSPEHKSISPELHMQLGRNRLVFRAMSSGTFPGLRFNAGQGAFFELPALAQGVFFELPE